ncbi:MAG: hypothetical protein ING88_01805 [Cytophagales bacterium]|nr:hypothetical protein [Cytophagales bacterium]
MYQFRLLCLFVGCAASLFLTLGLFKPWLMLWWEDVQNRMKVIKLYGSIAAVFFLIYWVLGII